MPAVVVPLGPNPAALPEALWRLCMDGEHIDAVWVVLESRAARNWYELEAPGPLGELRARFPQHLAAAPLHCRGPVADSPDEDAFGEALFAAVAQAQAAAERVVLTLSGGRWRGSAALTSTVFQLLARLGDRLVDVRVDRREAEGATGFYFPAQARQALRSRRGVPFRAAEVGVHLVPVEIPRLRALLGPHPPSSLAAARADAVAAVDEVAPPVVRLDLFTGAVTVGGAQVPVSPAYFPYVAWLLHDRATGGGGIPTGDKGAFRTFLQAWEQAAPGGLLARRRQGQLASKLLDLDDEAGGDIRDQISRARRAWHRSLAAAQVPRRDLLQARIYTETVGHELQPLKRTRHRVDLPADRIVLVGKISGR